MKGLPVLGLLSHRLGKHDGAGECCHETLLTGQAASDPGVQARTLTCMGHALVRLSRLDRATNARRQALSLRRQMAQHYLANVVQASLAGASPAQGDLPQAQAPVEEILSYLKTANPDGT